MLVVCAAGNWDASNDTTPVWPAGFALTYPNVISVGASNTFDTRAGLSDYGAKSVTIFAPGELVLAPEPGGDLAYASGSTWPDEKIQQDPATGFRLPAPTRVLPR